MPPSRPLDLIATLPDRYPIAPALAWRPHLLAALAVAGVGLVTRRRTRGLGALAGVAAVAGLADVTARTSGSVAPASPDDLTVLVANVWKSRADPAALAALLLRARPHLVSLPEAHTAFRDALLPLVPGYRGWASKPPGLRRTSGVTLLVADTAGDVTVTVGSSMRSGPVEATGGILGERTFVAAHTVSPTTPASARGWCADLEVVGAYTRAAVAPIVAGDLNATLDHRALRRASGGCRSAADLAGAGLAATFPSVVRGRPVPPWAGILIDHVLVPADAVITRYELLDVPGSDHRGVLVSLRLP